MTQIELQGKVIFLHGPPKVGKTQIASSFPEPVQFLATEPGHDYIPEIQKKNLKVLPPGKDGWTVFKAYIQKGPPDKAKTIVIDTIGDLYDSCMDWICDKFEWEHPADAAHGKGWAALKREFSSGLASFVHQAKTVNGSTIIYIDHTKTEEIKVSDEIYTKLSIAMSGQAHGIVIPGPDHIWMVGYGDEASSTPGGLKTYDDERVLFIGGNKSVEAGTRDKLVKVRHIRHLPESKQFDYILKELRNGSEAAKEKR